MSNLSITVYADRDSLDPLAVIPAERWPEAWSAYDRMMTQAVQGAYPSAVVDVVEEQSPQSMVIVGCGDPGSAEW